MNSWNIILATIVIFGAGVMSGGLLVNHIDRANRFDRRPPVFGEFRPGGERGGEPGHGMEFPRPRQPDLLNTNFVKRLDDALKLTAEQRTAIEKIIADGQEQNHNIWTNNSEQMRRVTQDVRRRLHDALTPDQQKQLDELMPRPPRRRPGFTNMPPGAVTAPASTNKPVN